MAQEWKRRCCHVADSRSINCCECRAHHPLYRLCRHETDGAIERRVEAKLAKLREEQDARDFMRNRKESANPCGSEAIEQQWNSHVAKMEEQEAEFKNKAQMAQSRALEAEWQPRVFATVPAPAKAERCDWKEHAEISAVMRRLGARA